MSDGRLVGDSPVSKLRALILIRSVVDTRRKYGIVNIQSYVAHITCDR